MERVKLDFPHGYLFSNKVAFDLQLPQFPIPKLVLTFALLAPEIKLVHYTVLT